MGSAARLCLVCEALSPPTLNCTAFFLQSPLLLMLQLDGRRAQLRRRLATGERRLAVCSLQLGLEDSPSMAAGLKAAGKAREAQRFQLAKMLEEE